jgi:hypothetical protein
MGKSDEEMIKEVADILSKEHTYLDSLQIKNDYLN